MSHSQASSPQENPLGTQPIAKLLMRYGVPSIISMVVMSLYNIVDQIFIGRFVGYLGNSATTVAFPLIAFMLAVALMVGNGSAALMSLELGRGNKDAPKRIIGNAMVLMVGAGLAMIVLYFLFQNGILRLLGCSDEVLPYARPYTSWIVAGAPFAMISSGISSVIRADGSPRFSMVATLCGALLNIVLDPIFIYTFDLGVAGAAIATILSQFVSAGVCVYYICRRANLAKLARREMRLEASLVRRIAALGSSSFVTQFAISIFNIVLNNVVTYYGDLSPIGSSIPLAAVGIVMKVNAIVISVILGVAIGAQPILGFNYGAGNYARVKKTYLTTISITFVAALLGNLLFIFKPEVVIAIFGDSSGDFNSFAAYFMRTYLCVVCTAGIQIPSANYFQAVGKPTKAMVLSMTRQILFLMPLVVILPIFLGLDGIAYAAPVADLMALVLTLIFIVREMRHLDKSIAGGSAQPVQGNA